MSEWWKAAPVVEGNWWEAAPVVEGPQKPKPAGGVAFLNQGIASALDAPVAASSAIGRGVAGLFGYDSPPIPTPARAGMEAGGVNLPQPGQTAETYGERIGEGVGLAAGSLLPGAGVVGAVSRFGGPTASAVAGQVARPFQNTPLRALGAETAAGAGAGAGGKLAEDQTQDATGLARVGGELAGGMAAAMAPGAALRGAGRAAEALPLTGALIRAGRAAIVPFTEAGARVRANRRLTDLAGDPQAAARALEGDSIGGLTPAQMTGDERLMGLERAILDADAGLDEQFKRKSGETVTALREALTEAAQGATAQDAQAAMQSRRDYLGGLLQTRMTQAEERIRSRLSGLSPQRRETENSVIVRQEIDKAWSDARRQENELWGAVPRDATVPTDTTRSTFDRLTRETPTAQQEDIPAVARQILSEEGGAWGSGVQSVAEMHGLYSKLRETARNARAGASPQRNKARIADALAEGILVDLGARADTVSDVGKAINTARTFSAQVAETFEQGTVGRLVGRLRDGGDAVDPSLTLGTTVGRGGSQAKVAVDDIRAAVGNRGDAATGDYLLRRFNEYAAPRGEMNQGKAQDFVRQNAEVLERFPQLRQRMTEAASARDASRIETDAGRVAAINDPRQSAGAAFIEAPYAKEFQTVLSARNPREAARMLSREAAKDTSGVASRGLKGAAFDFLIGKAQTGRFDDAGQPTLSGNAIMNSLRDTRTRQALGEVFAPAEMERIAKIGREMQLAERAQGRLPDVGGVMNDAPASVISYIGRVFAARQGARAGAGTSGASLLTANFASRKMQEILGSLTNDKAASLLRDAIQDKELFRDLLTSADTPARARQVETRLTEWMAGQAAQEIPTQEGQQEGEQGDWWQSAPQVEPQSSLPPKVERITQASQQANRPVAPITLARAFTGANESRDASVIGAFIERFGGSKINPAETAWCAAFVNAVLGASGGEGTGKLNARSFLEWGKPVDRPQQGDVAVLWREDPNSWKGHVGFFAGYETKDGKRFVRIVGGNQNDSVSEKLYPADRLLGFRRA